MCNFTRRWAIINVIINFKGEIMRRTKIVCTIGPASDSEKVLEALFKEGLKSEGDKNVCKKEKWRQGAF